MKNPTLRRFLPIGFAALAVATAPAATLNWTGGTLGDGTTWTDSLNWGGSAIGPSGDDLIIATRNGIGNMPAQTLDLDFSIRSLSFDNSAGRYPVGGLVVNSANATGARLLILDTPDITNVSIAANTDVTLFRTSGGTFNLQLANGQNTFDIGANSSLTLGPINGAGTGSGVGLIPASGAAATTSLTKTGPGTLYLGLNSTYTGGLTIAAGTVVMNGSPAQLVGNGAGGVTVNGGTLRVQGATAQSGDGRPFKVGSSIGTFEVDSGKIIGIAGAISNVSGQEGVLRKTGSGILSLEMGKNQAQYTGGTIVEEGTFRMVNQLALGAAGAVGITVKDGGILQAGFTDIADQPVIRGDAVFEQNSQLDLGVWARTFPFPGGNQTSTTGFLTIEGNLDISGAADSATPAFLWDLKTPATSDRVTVNSAFAMNIGAGDLAFSDFTFTPDPLTFGVGTYTIFATSNPIIGTLDSSLSGAIGSLFGTLQINIAGNSLELVVTVPEPSTYALLGLGGLLGLVVWRRSAGGTKKNTLLCS